MATLPVDPPPKRPLKIFAFDPMRGRDPLGAISVEVENEPLAPGPSGARVKVVDYDGAAERYLAPVDLEDPAVLMAGGLAPSESDPRFHQQMVYAVTMKVLENFDRALGRRVNFWYRPLLLVPHAFEGQNAFYDPERTAVFFGHFRADAGDPGENLPGQPVFTCLSQDIVAHEVTHALVHRMRSRSLEATNEDVLAFHEAFADIVAIFQHFSFPGVLRDAIRRSAGDIGSASEMAELAAQFGHATGRGTALRSAIDKADPSRYLTVTEPHERGSILVAAVFEGFFKTYHARVQNLLRLGTSFDPAANERRLHPDLIDRVAEIAAKSAQTILTMCIRAFEYLPPLDITFGDFLRALITADRDLLADEGADQRRMMIEAFRKRGIYPTGVTSLSEAALCWPEEIAGEIPRMPSEWVAQALLVNAQEMQLHGDEESRKADHDRLEDAKRALQGWAAENAEALRLSPGGEIEAEGFHGTFRVAPSGRLVVEVIARFSQSEGARDDPRVDGLRFGGGTTVVASSSGEVRFVISKPLASEERRERQLRFVESRSLEDAAFSWTDGAPQGQERLARVDFARLHRGLAPR